MSHWKRKKAVWAIEREPGKLLYGFLCEPQLFDRKADAVAVFKACRTYYKLARIVKVLVKYEEIPL